MTSRDRALAAALELFDRQGYSATTIEDIRQRSGVSVGSIYHHFRHKEGIASVLYIDALRDFRRGLLDGALQDAGAEQGVRAAVAHHLGWCDANRARARLLMRRREAEVADLVREDVDGLNRLTFETIELWYWPHVTAGELRELPLALLYAVWFGPAQEYARLVLGRDASSESFPGLREATPTLADAAWAALRA